MTYSLSTIVCPDCRAPQALGTNFCGRCGSDLRHVGRGAGRGGTSGERDVWLGRAVDGRYRVLERIGAGGMGVVYKVEHQRMGKIAAMKVMHRDLAMDREVVKRFRREAEAVSRLTHPNTVQTFDFGTVEGALYLVMEYVRGEDLGSIVRRDGPLPFARAAPIFIQICAALAEAHELGIVHRDLKPENILVTRTRGGDDLVKVVDFGLAKISEREEASDVTGRGQIVGTPYYMSPEQIRGEELDHRADLYSLGALMYRVLTGEHPFEAQSPVGVLTKHLTDPLVPPDERRPDLPIPAAVSALVVRTMARDKEERHATAEDLRADLEGVLDVVLGDPSASRSGPYLRRLRARTRPPTDGVAVAAGAALTPTTERRRATRDDTPALAREDFDAFEASLRRRALVRLVLVPLGLAAIVGGIVWYVRWSGNQPRSREREPNNDLATATLIAPGRPVRGTLGKRIDERTSDKDYFQLSVDGPGKRRLQARVSAITNLDLAIAVHDGAGTLLALGDNVGVGEPEIVPNLGVDPGRYYVAVLASRAHGDGVPTENVTDEYELVVAIDEPPAHGELEPNETDSDATPISAGIAVTGFLGRHGDVDRFRFAGGGGRYLVEVVGTGLPPHRITAGGAEGLGPRLEATLADGAIVQVARVDEAPAVGERPQAAGADRSYTLTITPVR